MLISKRDLKFVKEAAFKINPSDTGPHINSLDLPWQGVDKIMANCPKHIGVRLDRTGDETYKCPKGGEVYRPKGSVGNQTNRDNYYLGIVLKGPSVYPGQSGRV